MNKDFCMSKAPGNIVEGEIAHNNSWRSDYKRSHQWFTDGADAELFSNKKQAVEIPHPNSYTALLNSNIYCGNSSSFNSVAGQFTERLFDSETPSTASFDDRSLPSIGVGNMSMGRKVIADPFVIDSTFGLSISHPLVDPPSGISYGGIRKVKVNQVKDAEDFIAVSLGHAHPYSTDDAYSKADDESVTTGLAFDRGNDGVMSMPGTFNGGNNNFMSMSEPYNMGDMSEMPMDLSYRENSGSISVDPCASKNNSNITTMTQSFANDNENNKTIDALLMDQVSNTISIKNTYSQVDDIITSTSQTDISGLSMRHSFGNTGNNIISFGGLNEDADNISSSGRLVCNYDFLMGHPSLQRSEENGMSESTSGSFVSGVQVSTALDAITKRKEQKATKKSTPNNFPSNVRSLLSTGMLDGVPVKYVAWSREELRAVIKGATYLCGCQSCTFSKAINAYEFERHAGCKTKHPNNHIYFDSGKTIYGVVQELRNTPQNVLFEVIQTITGSPINQKCFRLWKDSFLAATRELQRIYGKEEGKTVT